MSPRVLSCSAPAKPGELKPSTAALCVTSLISQKEITPVGQNPSDQGLPRRFSVLPAKDLLPSSSPKISRSHSLQFFFFYQCYPTTLSLYQSSLHFYQIWAVKHLILPPQCCILFPCRLTTILEFPVLPGFLSHKMQFMFLHTVVVLIDLLWHMFLCALLNSLPVMLAQFFHKT